jgi:steroid 5-alpha reductase family enzyme
LVLVSWVLSLATREYSWVDRLWSIAPALYVAWYASRTDFDDTRLVLMTLLATAWGARLTYNYARKGGYARGGEDYRWGELRRRMGARAYQAFNLFFIAGFQNVLLFLLAAPAWVALQHAHEPLGPLDFVAALLFVALLVVETMADEQQWRFQRDKKARRARGDPVLAEFVTTGLFRYSRHPNFFCEQALWLAFYLFAVAASGRWLHPWLIGPLLLVALFHGSTTFTETLTLAKYPAYAAYQRRVSRLWPWWPRPDDGSHQDRAKPERSS